MPISIVSQPARDIIPVVCMMPSHISQQLTSPISFQLKAKDNVKAMGMAWPRRLQGQGQKVWPQGQGQGLTSLQMSPLGQPRNVISHEKFPIPRLTVDCRRHRRTTSLRSQLHCTATTSIDNIRPITPRKVDVDYRTPYALCIHMRTIFGVI